MKKCIFRNFQSPGDILMLTAAVRDLHRCLPGKFLTDVRTSCPALWENNPYLTPLEETDPDVEIIDCHYPLIHRSNQFSAHFLHGFIEFLNGRLIENIQLTAFKSDIHLSPAEKSQPSPISEIVGETIPYWIIVAGGKYDYTIKWWNFRRFQAVIDRFGKQIQFVQVGERGHYHPRLNRVIDLRGKTNLRELIQLVYHSQGALCPVTFLMHLAAAVEMKHTPDQRRPCVVVAGGREPPQWEAYPGHEFLHTVGSLSCCAEGGCWRSRTVPLGDGDEKDRPEALCVDVVGGLPRCMEMIRPEQVMDRIALYFQSGLCHYLSPAQANQTAPHLTRPPREWMQIEVNPDPRCKLRPR